MKTNTVKVLQNKVDRTELKIVSQIFKHKFKNMITGTDYNSLKIKNRRELFETFLNIICTGMQYLFLISNKLHWYEKQVQEKTKAHRYAISWTNKYTQNIDP